MPRGQSHAMRQEADTVTPVAMRKTPPVFLVLLVLSCALAAGDAPSSSSVNEETHSSGPGDSPSDGGDSTIPFLQMLETILAKLFALESKTRELKNKKRDVERKVRELEFKKQDLTRKQNQFTALRNAYNELVNSELHPLENKIEELNRSYLFLQTKYSELQEKYTQVFNAVGGSIFTLWGRQQCFSTTHQVYRGRVAGAGYNSKGNGANRLCLARRPMSDGLSTPVTYSALYGARYQGISLSLRHVDVPCAVCRGLEINTIMYPGSHNCPVGWTPQYQGQLTANQWDLVHSSEYLCLEEIHERLPGSKQPRVAARFYYAIGKCGSLSCVPYINDRVLTCSVCSQ